MLGKNTTALVATFISLVVGTIFFFINICLTGNLKTLASFNDINPKLLLGGVLGGLVIYFTVKSVPELRCIKNTYINSSITNDSRIFYRFTYIQRSYAFI